MTAAIFGLLGVAVGGLLQIAAEAIKQGRAERKRARVGARLLRHEFILLDTALEVLVELAPTGELAAKVVTASPAGVLRRWEEYSADLADTPAWKDVSAAVLVLRAKDHIGVDGRYRPPPEQAAVARDAIAQALKALKRPARTPLWRRWPRG